MRRLSMMIAVAVACGAAVPASAKCADEIKALEGKSASADSKNAPGQQKQTADPESSADPQGGGSKSASAKILEARAHNQKGDEAQCMRAVNEARAMTDQK